VGRARTGPAHWALTIIWALLATGGFVGCRGTGPPPPVIRSPEPKSAPLATRSPDGPDYGGTFTYAESSDIPALDPIRVDDTASYDAASQIYDGLTRHNANLEVMPALARDFSVSQDGLTWTFELRPEARYHDDPCFPGGRGRTVNAHDVKASLERVCDPESGSTGFWIFAGKILGADEFHAGRALQIEGFEVADSLTFRIHLTQAYPPLPRLLALAYAYIVPPEALTAHGEGLDQHPVGTGPFRLVRRTANELRLARHPAYWHRDQIGRPLPYLDSLIVRIIPQTEEEISAFEAGELDQLYPIPPSLFTTFVAPEGGVRTGIGNFVLQTSSALDVQYLGFNLDKPPFAGNRALRQALNYAVDRTALVRDVLRRGVPANHGVFPPGLPGFNREFSGYYFDLDRAQTLLAQAGYPGGAGLDELELAVNSGGTANVALAEAVAVQLGRIGVRVRVQVYPWAEHLDRIDGNEAGFFRLAWLADYPDPENFLSQFASDHLAPTGPNVTRYRNPEFDRVFHTALSTTDDEQRIALYQQAEALVVEDAPWIFLFYAENHRLIQPWVRGYRINPINERILERVWLERH
jgi:peptide/nickel transport system substrate-binding protein